jgi:hypothetical protein
MSDRDATELAKVKAKIRALSEKTMDRGCSEAEAFQAMQKVGELLAQFNLTMDAVTLSLEACVTGTFETQQKRSGGAVYWAHDGLRNICGVISWITPASWPREYVSYSAYGLQSDVDMWLYLANLITNANDTELSAFKRTDIYKSAQSRRIASANFEKGFGLRLRQRLLDLAQANKEAELAAQKELQERAVMVPASASAILAGEEALAQATREKYKLKNPGTMLISLAKAAQIEAEFAKHGPRLTTKTWKSSARFDYNAREAGSSAADRVNLGRPIGAGADSVLAIGYGG